MPRLKEVPKNKANAYINKYYDALFGDRDPAQEQPEVFVTHSGAVVQTTGDVLDPVYTVQEVEFDPEKYLRDFDYGEVSHLEPSIFTSSWNQPQDSRTLDANTWYHVAMVYDGTRIMNYIDAVGQNVQNLTGSMATSDQNVLLGRWYSGEYLDGRSKSVV